MILNHKLWETEVRNIAKLINENEIKQLDIDYLVDQNRIFGNILNNNSGNTTYKTQLKMTL